MNNLTSVIGKCDDLKDSRNKYSLSTAFAGERARVRGCVNLGAYTSSKVLYVTEYFVMPGLTRHPVSNCFN